LCCPLLRSGASIVLRIGSAYTKCQAYRQTVQMLLGFLTPSNRSGISGCSGALRLRPPEPRMWRKLSARHTPTAHQLHSPAATDGHAPPRTLEGENMISRRSFVGLAAAAAATGTVASCSGQSAGGDNSSRTLTVWHMHGDYTAETMKAINEKFTAKTGAKVDAQLQQWDGITTKVTSALATQDPPDVIDMGNTQVATYAANGALMDITPHKEDLQQGNTWLDGLVDPATIDGKLYGVPGFAGCRAVIYNKKVWKDAGITEEPTSFEQVLKDLEKIGAQHDKSTFSPLYLPGQMWYSGLQFLWDAGGQIATESGGTWEAGFSTPEGIQGLKDWKKFQNAVSSPASQSLDTDKPPIEVVFANGDAA